MRSCPRVRCVWVVEGCTTHLGMETLRMMCSGRRWLGRESAVSFSRGGGCRIWWSFGDDESRGWDSWMRMHSLSQRTMREELWLVSAR
jgi:hypothetical protein